MPLNPIKADNLTPEKHGFFTRLGGLSTGIYEGLNCGIGSNDDTDTVISNREMVANTFDLDKSNLVSVYQIHSPHAVPVAAPFESAPPKCDAMVTATPGLALGILTISASVGPCISQKAYEVGPEFVEEFADTDPDFTQYFAGGPNDRAMFDLPRFVLDRLRASGLQNVAWTGHCTYSDPARFFSYRRTCHQNEPDYGRLISVITL